MRVTDEASSATLASHAMRNVLKGITLESNEPMTTNTELKIAEVLECLLGHFRYFQFSACVRPFITLKGHLNLLAIFILHCDMVL